MKIRPVGAESYGDGRADGQTDMTKLIAAFCNFAYAPKMSTLFQSVAACSNFWISLRCIYIFGRRESCHVCTNVANVNCTVRYSIIVANTGKRNVNCTVRYSIITVHSK
jgi:hypothetical protein